MLTFLLWQDRDLFGFRHLSSDQSSVECNSSVSSDFSLSCAFHICLSRAPPSGQSGTQAVVSPVLHFQAYSVLYRVRSMYTQNAGGPSSLTDFFPPTHFLSVIFLVLSNSLGPLWSFGQKTGTFSLVPVVYFPQPRLSQRPQMVERETNQNRGVSYPLGSQHL